MSKSTPPSGSFGQFLLAQHRKVQLDQSRQSGSPARLRTQPTDPLFADQWHLVNTGQTGGLPGIDINVASVWADYTGAGINVGLIDDGVESVHDDLFANYNSALEFDAAENDGDAAPSSGFDYHGTSVAGLIAASANGVGGVGVAPDASISGLRLDFFTLDESDFIAQVTAAFYRMANFDVVNNSWGYTIPFYDNFSTPQYEGFGKALQHVAETGRDGLGTVVVFAGGNGRGFDNANYHNLENSRFTIAVAAINHFGESTFYSTPGASLLVSAPGGEFNDAIATTDLSGAAGDDPSDYTQNFGGTSAAAPIVSGVVALMLQANASLGYRDVQEILAYSARQTDATDLGWSFNGAKNWNGGGLHVSHDYGFGLVDAHAAVRLAETWTAQSTLDNEQVVSETSAPALEILDLDTVSDSITITESLKIDQIEVVLDLEHTYLGDLVITLTSPDGTESVLVANPDSFDTEIKFTLSSTHHWGETGVGTWTLSITDEFGLDTGILNRWTLKLYGDAPSDDDTYIYTNEFGNFKTDASRTTLSDAAGVDTLNLAAVTSDLEIDLTPGATSLIAGNTLTIAAGTWIENAYGGDRDDQISGNALGNLLWGRRGEDFLRGRAGNDILQGEQGDDRLEGDEGADMLMGGDGNDALAGGRGNDTLSGGTGGDRFLYTGSSAFSAGSFGVDTITDFNWLEGDQLVLSKRVFTALTSAVGDGFSKTNEFAVVASDRAAARSRALIVYNQTSGALFYNQNGNGVGLGSGAKFAVLSSTPALEGIDFALVA
ncbi:MAG: hypothetical protein Fur0046_34170 [Cyanobacteria bacterium J069]|nr:MAG: furin [Cyanobacteria bacterium J069]